jgi:ureidoglycolate lyase
MAPTVRRLIPLHPLTPDAFSPFGSVVQNPSSSAQKAYSHIAAVHANQGSASKYPDISPLDNFYSLASSSKPGRGAISLFSSKPRATRSIDSGKSVFDVTILERHPYTTQTFLPLGLSAQNASTKYLVIVAPTLPAGGSRAEILDRPSAYPANEKARRPGLPGVLSRAKSTDGQLEAKLPKGSGPPDLNGVQAFIARGDQAVTYGAGTWHAPMVVLGENTVDFAVVQFVNGVPLEDCQEKEFAEGIAVDLTDLSMGGTKSRL